MYYIIMYYIQSTEQLDILAHQCIYLYVYIRFIYINTALFIYILIGKKFSSGASVSDLATGGKEVVIQGDVYFDVPALLINEFKVLLVYVYVVLVLCYMYAYAYCEICAYSYMFMCICLCVYVYRLRSRVFSFKMTQVGCNRANRDG